MARDLGGPPAGAVGQPDKMHVRAVHAQCIHVPRTRMLAHLGGIYSSHLSPSTIICMASVHPRITWLGANLAGWPRSYELSNLSPLGKLAAVRPS